MTVKVVRLKITASEWEVMDAVWKLGEASSRQIIEAMKGHRPRWNAKTIRTFINRLVEKKAVKRRRVGGEYVYRSAAAKEQCLLPEAAKFMERIGKKGFAPLLALYLAYHRPGKKEKRELRAILEKRRTARKR